MHKKELELEQKRQQLLNSGVIMLDSRSVYVEETVTVGEGTLLLPGTILRGNTIIGKNCEIGPNTMISDCSIGDFVTINSSQCNDSTVANNAKIGPFAYIRPNSDIGENVKIGDFVEIKNSVLGSGTKVSHLTYVGDCDVGKNVNFGCGSVVVNYDGNKKHRSTIGDNCFVGCNTNLVSPVNLGESAYTAAGSTITKDVAENSLAVARAQQKEIANWVSRHNKKK